MTADAEATSRANTEAVIRSRLAAECNRCVNELERAAGHARGILDDQRLAHPSMAGMRARLLSALVAVGAVALNREE
jgi:hypothetical protein